MARMSPVFTSMTTAVPPVAWDAGDLRAQRLLGHVLHRLVDGQLQPGARPGGHRVVAGAGQRHAVGRLAGRRRTRPCRPACDWYWYSSPDVPCPFHPTVPTTGSASCPSGCTRCDSGTRLIPVRPSVVTSAATGVGHPVGEVDEAGRLGELATAAGRPGCPSTGARARRRPAAGSVMISGSATTVCLVTDSARTSPLRS